MQIKNTYADYNDKNEHTCVPNLTGKAFSLSPSQDEINGLCGLYYVEVFSFIWLFNILS